MTNLVRFQSEKEKQIQCIQCISISLLVNDGNISFMQRPDNQHPTEYYLSAIQRPSELKILNTKYWKHVTPFHIPFDGWIMRTFGNIWPHSSRISFDPFCNSNLFAFRCYLLADYFNSILLSSFFLYFFSSSISLICLSNRQHFIVTVVQSISSFPLPSGLERKIF